MFPGRGRRIPDKQRYLLPSQVRERFGERPYADRGRAHISQVVLRIQADTVVSRSCEMKSDSEFERSIHARLLSADATAPEELARKYLDPVYRHVRARGHAHGIHDLDLINDATVDSVFGYIRHPEKFTPQKSSLLSYLKLAAERDLINAVAKDRRLKRGEDLTSDVEVSIIRRNKPSEIENIRRDAEGEAIAGIQQRGTIRAAIGVISDERDREFLNLMANGERRTRRFAKVLKIDNLSLTEQRHVVKQHKDRLKQQLKRWRKKQSD